MIGIDGWLHLELLVHTQVTKNCFVIVWLLETKRVDLPLGPVKQIRIHAVERRGSPHIYTNL